MLTGMLRRLRTTWSSSGALGVLMRGSAVSFLLNTAGYALSYMLQLLFARVLGSAEYGLLSYAFAWISIGLIVGKLGFDTALVRFVPEYRATRQWSELRGLLGVARWLPLVWSCALAALATAAVLWLGGSTPRRLAIAACWLVPCGILLELNSSALRSLKRVGFSLVGDSLLRPVLTAVLLLVVIRLVGVRPSGLVALACYTGVTAVIGFVGIAWIRAATASMPASVQPRYHVKYWLSTSMPLMFAAGFQVMLYALDTLMVGRILGTTEAGFYSVAGKIALLTLFAMNAAQVIGGPLMSEARATGAGRDLQRIVSGMIWLSMIVAVPGVVLLSALAGPVLEMFGADFRSAAGPLVVLSLAQLFNVATGPSGLLLVAGGYQRVLALLLGVGVLVNVILNVIWIPAYGLMGAAYAALVAQVCWNAIAAVFIRRSMGVNCTILCRPVWLPARAAATGS